MRSELAGRYDGNIRRAISVDSIASTTHTDNPRLPPGPMASPGLASLDAVVCIQPSRSTSYFAAKKNDGFAYVFSKTLAEHSPTSSVIQGGSTFGRKVGGKGRKQRERLSEADPEFRFSYPRASSPFLADFRSSLSPVQFLVQDLRSRASCGRLHPSHARMGCPARRSC